MHTNATNLQIVANNVARVGEVALYAGLALHGAALAKYIVEKAAISVSVTNFNDGGVTPSCRAMSFAACFIVRANLSINVVLASQLTLT